MRLKGFLLLAAVLMLTLSFVSCSNYLGEAEGFFGGELVDGERLSSIAESIFAEDESLRPEEETTEEQTEAVTDRVHDGIFHWTESGSKYHKWSDCPHIKNSDKIISGNLIDAEDAKGTGELCSDCAK